MGLSDRSMSVAWLYVQAQIGAVFCIPSCRDVLAFSLFFTLPNLMRPSLLQILSGSSFSLVRFLLGSCLINPECSEMMERFDIYAV